MRALLMPLFCIAFFISGCGGGGGGDSIESLENRLNKQKDSQQKIEAETREKLQAAASALKNAKSIVDFSKTESGGKSQTVVISTADLEKANDALKELMEKQSDISNQTDELLALHAELTAERSSLEFERDQLKADKEELEKHEKLLSMGFYAALAATATTIFAAIARVPMVLLDREHRRFEILQRRLEVRKLRRELRKDNVATSNAPFNRKLKVSRSRNSNRQFNS